MPHTPPDWVILETPRTLLRAFSLADLDELATIYQDDELFRYFGRPGARSREETRESLLRVVKMYDDFGYSLWATLEKQTGRLIGRCGLIPQLIDDRIYPEIGYLLARSSWGKGLATEVAAAVRDLGFEKLGFKRMISLIHPLNTASQRVAEKNGLTYERDIVFSNIPCRLYGINEQPLRGPTTNH